MPGEVRSFAFGFVKPCRQDHRKSVMMEKSHANLWPPQRTRLLRIDTWQPLAGTTGRPGGDPLIVIRHSLQRLSTGTPSPALAASQPCACHACHVHPPHRGTLGRPNDIDPGSWGTLASTPLGGAVARPALSDISSCSFPFVQEEEKPPNDGQLKNNKRRPENIDRRKRREDDSHHEQRLGCDTTRNDHDYRYRRLI